jgi:hypothetical protein
MDVIPLPPAIVASDVAATVQNDRSRSMLSHSELCGAAYAESGDLAFWMDPNGITHPVSAITMIALNGFIVFHS